MTAARKFFRKTTKLELRADTVLMGSAEIARAISATAVMLSEPAGSRLAPNDGFLRNDGDDPTGTVPGGRR